MKALSKAKAATIYEVAAARRRVDRDRVPGPARLGSGHRGDPRPGAGRRRGAATSRPAGSGRSLAEGRHAANGIVFPDLVGPYYAEVVLGYEEVAAELGSSVLILATHGRPDAATRGAGAGRPGRRHGPHGPHRRRRGGREHRRHRAARSCCWPATRSPASTPSARRQRAQRPRRWPSTCVAHGHRRFAFLGDPAESPDVAGRYAGFAAGAARRGLRRAGAGAVRLRRGRRRRPPRPRPLRRRDPPDAIVCANDEMALGVHLARPRSRACPCPTTWPSPAGTT